MTAIGQEPIADQARRVLEPVIEREGFELVEVEWGREGPSWVLRLYVARRGAAAAEAVRLRAVRRRARAREDVRAHRDRRRAAQELDGHAQGLPRRRRRDRGRRRAPPHPARQDREGAPRVRLRGGIEEEELA